MDHRFDRIENKVDKIHDELVEVKLGYMEHERRSIANEAAVAVLGEQFKPVHDLLLQVRFMHRIIVALASIAGFIYTILEIKSRL